MQHPEHRLPSSTATASLSSCRHVRSNVFEGVLAQGDTPNAVEVVSPTVREPTATKTLPETVASLTLSSTPGDPPHVRTSAVARFTAQGWLPVLPTSQDSFCHVTCRTGLKLWGVCGTLTSSAAPVESTA